MMTMLILKYNNIMTTNPIWQWSDGARLKIRRHSGLLVLMHPLYPLHNLLKLEHTQIIAEVQITYGQCDVCI